MSVAGSVYRQLLKALRVARAEGIPCTGCVGLPQLSLLLCPEHALGAAFRHNNNLNDAFHALRMLPKQLAVLRASEEETRQALHQWSSLQLQWCQQAPLSAVQQLAAAESAAWLLQRLVTQQTQQQMLCEADIQELQRQSEDSIKAAQKQLDVLAADARSLFPHAFEITPLSPPSRLATQDQHLQQLEALTQVLFKHNKLRNAPFEWVYDGLAPALLPQVLQRGKGMPLSLALAAAAVGRRLDIPLQLLCAPEGQTSGTASGPLLLQHLPPEVAARQAGRTTASAPDPDNWLLQLLPPPGQQWDEQQAVFLDVRQNGKLLNTPECLSRYPELQTALQQQQQQQRTLRTSNSSTADPTTSSSSSSIMSAAPLWDVQNEEQYHSSGVVAVWSSLARTMVLAHQRRGESDWVAHWLYQLLALDSRAEEWAHVLKQ